ncbi:hypothetical protein NDU88_005566 [Pleurodeles waltl]|uniref:Uncharacterized protein n=1 Tax=Pleurodeles waltl TaxID=8319 RepID=A0AAV7VMD6_PLEWA|nr:hypothetical protein NDU88_005566 [Pleurodeles waltl]
MRRLPAGPRAPPPCFRNPGAPEGDPLQWAGAAREVRGRPQHAPRANRRSNKEEEGGGSRGPNRPPVRLPPSPLLPCPRASQSGEAAAAFAHPTHTSGASARGEQPALGLSTLPRLPDPGSSQTRPKHRRPASRGEAPGVRSLSAPIRMDLSG